MSKIKIPNTRFILGLVLMVGYYFLGLPIFAIIEKFTHDSNFILFLTPAIPLIVSYLIFRNSKQTAAGIMTGVLTGILFLTLMIVEIIIHPPDEE